MTKSEAAAAVHGELLLELSFLVNERKRVEEIFASFARRLLEAAAFDYTTLLAGEPDSGYMEVVASYPFELPGATAGVSISTRSFKYEDLLAATDGYEYTTRIESTTPASRELAAAGMSRAWVQALVSDGKVYGTLTIARKSPELFGADERAFLLSAVRLLTAAVRQEFELQHALRAAARAQAANELALALNSGETIEQSFQRLTDLVATSLAVDYFGLFLDREGGFMLVDETPRGVHRGDPPTKEGTKFILERLAATNFTQARPQRDASPSNAVVDAGYKRLGIAVLRESETPVGLLMFGRTSSQKFNDEDQAFIELLRSMLSQTLTNRRRLARSEAEAARSRTLNEVALLLNRGETVQAILARLLDLLDSALNLDYAGLLEATNVQRTFRMIGSRPELVRPVGDEVTFDADGWDRMVESARPLVQYRLEDARDLAEYNRVMSDQGMRRAIAVVIRDSEEVVGLLAIARRNVERYQPDELAFIETLCSMLGQAIANQRRLERAQVAAARAIVLNEAALLLKQDQPAEQVVSQLLPLLEGALAFDYIGLLEADRPSNELVLIAAEPQIVRAPGERIALSNQLVDDLSGAESPITQYRLANVPTSQDGVSELIQAGMERGVTALLRQGEQVVGMFTLARRNPQRLDDEEMAFIGTLASLLGQAIANRRHLERAERQAARSRLLNEIAVQLDAGEPLENLFSLLRGRLPEAVDFDQVVLLTTMPNEGGMTIVGSAPSHGLAPGSVLEWPIDRVILNVLRQRAVLQVDPRQIVGSGATLLADNDYRHSLVAILRDGDDTLGALVLSRHESREFDDEQVAFIEMLATVLSRAVANQVHLEKARTHAARTQLLSEISVLLHNGEGPEAMFAMLTARLPEQIAFDALALLVFEGADRLRVVGSLRRNSMKPGALFSVEDMGNAIERLAGKELVWETAIEDVLGRIGRVTEAAGVRRAMIVALKHNQETVGFLFVARTTPEAFFEGERAYVEILATIIAQAIANHRKIAESHADAIRSQVLSELAILLQEGDAISSRFDRFSELLMQAVGYDHISVSVRQIDGDGYQVVRSHELTLDGVPLEFNPADIDFVREVGRTAVQYKSANSDRTMPRALAQAGFARAATAMILSNEGVEGLFTVGRTQDVPFDDKEMGFIELVAALFGQAAANHRKAWVKAQEQEEQAIIAEAASAVAREMTGLGIVFAVRQSVARFIPEAFCNFGYLEGDRIVFSAPGRDRIELPIGPGFRNALDSGYDLVPQTVSRDGSPESRVEVERTGLQSHVITRAQSGGETVGILIIGSRNTAFSPGDREVRLSRLIADIVGPAMANVRAIERQRLEGEDQRLLAEVAAVAAREAEPAALLAALHRPMRAIVPSPVVIFGFREGEQTIYPRLDGNYVVVPIDEYSRMLDEVGQIHSDELPDDLFAESELWQMGIHAISSTAVLAGGKTVGYLMVGSRTEGYSFSERELRLFRLLAQIVGPAMDNARSAARARADAEEQAILAEAAAALAAGATEPDVIATLTPSIRRFIPTAMASVFFVDGELLAAAEGQVRAPFGPIADLAMSSGQVVVEKPWPAMSTLGLEMLELGKIERFVNTSLNAGGASTGILFVGVHEQSITFSERDLRLIRLIADMAGPAIANARESTRRRLDAEEQRFLAETAAAAAGAASEAELVRGMARPFAELLPGSKIDLFYAHEGGMLSAITGMVLPIGKNFRAALDSGQAVAPAGSPGTTSMAAKREREMGTRFGTSTRLSSGGQTLGLFWLGTLSDEPPTERDLRICRLVADVVGPALANLRESRRRKEDAEEQRFLAEAASAAASASTQGQLVRDLARPFAELIPGSRVDLFYADGEGLRSTITGQFFPIGPHFEAALQHGQRVGEPHAPGGTTEASEALSRLRVIQATSTRLSSGGQTQGLLWIGSTDPERLFTDRDLRICRLVADVVGPALANLRESSRRKDDAEEQRFLAAVAAAAATATSEQELIVGLRDPFRSLTPNALVSFFFRDGDMLRTGDQLFGIGPQIEDAFRTGQSVGQIADPEVILASAVFMRANGIARWVNTTAASEGVTLGILHVALRDLAQDFSERELRMYRLAADIVGPAMAHLRENARRAREADDERVLASVAAMAAVTASSDELMDRFNELLGQFVSEPAAVYGHVEGEFIRYRVSNANHQALLGMNELVVPMIGASRDARARGQGHGSLADRTGQPYSPLGLHAYCVTSYHSVGADLGMLLVASSDPEYRFSDADLGLLRRIAQVLGPAIEAARAEQERARQAELYSLMLRSLSEGVILADNAGRPVFANDLGRKVLHSLDPHGEAVDWETIVRLLPEDAREPYRLVFQEGKGGRGRSALVIDGQLTHLDYEFVPLNDPQMRLLVVVTDVTQDVLHAEEQERSRDRMEQAARLAALGELIGGVAHELNNPLTAVVGFAELMSANPAAEPLAEEISVIQKEARRAADIVRDLLFIARPGTSERTKISVSDLVGHIERIRRAHWIGAGIQPSIAIEPGCQVWGNEHQLTQVILNLVTNAEHALVGQPDRRLSLTASCTGGRTKIAIADTGKGMDEPTLARIWEPFFTTKPGVGTGLGLPLSYSIIQSHHGQVLVESSPGTGTTFHIDLPSGPDFPSEPEEEPERDVTTARVLVVDDEPSLRKVCQRLVASLGHECETAESSSAAIEFARTRDFDLVLCDYRLATETADHVIAGFQEVAPHLIPRTVIATGATTDAGVVELTQQYGLELIAKPYGADELSRIIGEALARSASAEST